MPTILASYGFCQLQVKPACLLESMGSCSLIRNFLSSVQTINNVYVIVIGMKILHSFAFKENLAGARRHCLRTN